MPIEDDAFFLMLGIAMRAGTLAFGEDGVRRAVSTGRAALVLVDEGASENTRKAYANCCAYYGVKMRLTKAGRLSQAVGKGGRMSAAVTHGPLCDKLLALAGESRARA